MKFGDKVRDKVTGFEGIVTGRVSYMTGCDQYAVTHEATAEGKTPCQWIDVACLEVIQEAAVFIPKPVTAADAG